MPSSCCGPLHRCSRPTRIRATKGLIFKKRQWNCYILAGFQKEYSRDCTTVFYRYLEQLPPTLFVTELLARSAVQMSKHYIVQCQFGFLTDRQLTKLQVLLSLHQSATFRRHSPNFVLGSPSVKRHS